MHNIPSAGQNAPLPSRISRTVKSVGNTIESTRHVFIPLLDCTRAKMPRQPSLLGELLSHRDIAVRNLP